MRQWNNHRKVWSAGLAAVMAAGWCQAAAPETGDTTDMPEEKPAKPGSREAILRELRDASKAGMHRRLGPDFDFYNKDKKAAKFPEVFLAPSKQDPGGRRYQIGGPWTKEAGDFSSTQGQILYAPTTARAWTG